MSNTSVQKVDLTQEDLNECGIKTQLTQNDLLEVLVTEKLAMISQEIEDINEKKNIIIKAIAKEKDDFYEDCKSKAVAILKKKGIDVDPEALISIGSNNYSDKFESRYIRGLATYKDRNKEYILSSYDNNERPRLLEKPDTIDVVMNVNVVVTDIVSKDISFTQTYKVNVSFRHKVDHTVFLKAIADHNKLADSVALKYKNINIDYNSVLKEMRVVFNKKLIAAGSPKLRTKIYESLGLTI